MSAFETCCENLRANPKRWLLTGVAGFIGSNLLEALLRLGQKVVGVDNFSTGYRHNLDDVAQSVGPDAWKQFAFVEGDIFELERCLEASRGIDVILHQAALGSVPRSILDPIASHRANVDGFLNILTAAKENGVGRLVYASSSSVYGDSPELPKVEERVGNPLSPYALTKKIDELYAAVFTRTYALHSIGLRYFNVFGPRQDPNGAYAAVIPRWIGHLLNNQPCIINGDGKTSRDFCYVENVVQANLLAATTVRGEALDQVYNVACGERIDLSELYRLIRELLAQERPHISEIEPIYQDFRAGDILHSLACIDKAASMLGYMPTHSVRQGMEIAVSWYLKKQVKPRDVV